MPAITTDEEIDRVHGRNESFLLSNGASAHVKVHLIVLQHGLWGNPGHMSKFKEYMEQRLHGTPVEFLNSSCNVGKLTYDGIDVCGDRLVDRILSHLAWLESVRKSVTRISFVGYSLGGLIVRYAIGKLFSQGLFNKIKAVNLVTFASPHLGSWLHNKGLLPKTFNSLVPLVSSRTGYQLMMKDAYIGEECLLCALCDPKLAFYQGLKQFESLMSLANIRHDPTVPYCTAAMAVENPYDSAGDCSVSEEYPSIVTCSAPNMDEDVRTEIQKAGYKGRLRITLLRWAFPLFLPFWIYLIVVGTWHYSNIAKQTFDNQWLHMRQSKSQAALDELEADHEDTHEEEEEEEPSSDDPSSIDGSFEDSDGAPLLASNVVEHEGLVQRPVDLRTKQLWMIDRMNALGWRRVDVNVRHYHAHAAVMLRDERFKDQSLDHFKYVFDELFMPYQFRPSSVKASEGPTKDPVVGERVVAP